MSELRRKKRTDKNQADIVRDLRKRAIQVVLTNQGGSFPDLLLGTHCQWVLAEIKEPGAAIKRGQLKFMYEAKGFVGVATTYEEAEKLATFPSEYALKYHEKEKIGSWLISHPTQKTLAVNQFLKVIGRA